MHVSGRVAHAACRTKEGARRAEPRPRTAGEERVERPHVIGEDVFRTVLVRERLRSDRSGQPLLVLLLEIDGSRAAGTWNAAIDALAAASRDTDVLGWFEQSTVMGLIVPEVGASAVQISGQLARGVRRELIARLDPGSAARVSFRIHVHPDAVATEKSGLQPLEPLFQALRSEHLGSPLNEAFKRGLDFAATLMLLALLSPLFLILAALVKLNSPGPILFRQVRIGRLAKPFTMLKFRTMRVNADSAIHQAFVSELIKAGGQRPDSAKGGVLKIVNDPRVTSVGRILRKTSLDELPQFWNVLMGDMSLVGPRPPLAYEVEQYQAWHRRRVLDAKSGITGLWQVTGRSRTTFDEMVRLDLRYARKCSLWTDIKILLATPRAVISGKGAC